MDIPLDKILPNPEQPRTEFDDAELVRLAESIAEHGVIQPITVESAEGGYYILHDGERRWRAAQLAGLETIPAHVLPGMNGSGSQERLIRAMVANIQRVDLNPVEEGRAYRRMIDELGMNMTRVARTVGVSQMRIIQRLKLLELEEPIQAHIVAGRLPKDLRAVEALLSLPDSETRVKLAERAAERKMTVKGVVESCRRMNDHLAAQRGEAAPAHPVPAIRTATRREPLNRQRWDALAQVGKLPPWILVETAARDTCQSCAWHDQASEAICKSCPLPQMLALLIGMANRG